MDLQNLILTFTWKNNIHIQAWPGAQSEKKNYKVRLAVTIFKIYYEIYNLKCRVSTCRDKLTIGIEYKSEIYPNALLVYDKGGNSDH